MRSIRWMFVVVAGALLASTACSQPEAQSWQPGTPVTVRMLTHDSFALSQSLLDDLRTKTGIELQVITSGDAGAMVSGAILAAGAPSADLLFGVDNTLLARRCLCQYRHEVVRRCATDAAGITGRPD